MYRLPCTLSIALALGVNSFTVAQAPELAVTFLVESPSKPDQDSKPAPSILGEASAPVQRSAQDAKDFSLLNKATATPQAVVPDSEQTFSLLETPATGDAIDPTAKLETTFLEDMQSQGSGLAGKLPSDSKAGLRPIDFDQVFAALPSDKSFVASQPGTTPGIDVASQPVAIATLSPHPAPVARVPLPVNKVAPEQASAPVVELASKLQQPAVAAPAAPAMAATTTAIGNPVEPTAVIEEIEGDSATAVEVAPTDGVLPQPVAAGDSYATSNSTCDSCNSAMPCKCQNKKNKWFCVSDWWHSTHLYRNHVRHMGHPGMFCERPFGVCNEAWAASMIVAGRAERATLHDYDFVQGVDGNVELTHRGQGELARIARMMVDCPVPLSVESSFNTAEDTARISAVIDAIARLELPISPDSVCITADRTLGLSGVDAEAIQAIRINEVITGATRTQVYPDSAGAVVIPYGLSQDGGTR